MAIPAFAPVLRPPPPLPNGPLPLPEELEPLVAEEGLPELVRVAVFVPVPVGEADTVPVPALPARAKRVWHVLFGFADKTTFAKPL